FHVTGVQTCALPIYRPQRVERIGREPGGAGPDPLHGAGVPVPRLVQQAARRLLALRRRRHRGEAVGLLPESPARIGVEALAGRPLVEVEEARREVDHVQLMGHCLDIPDLGAALLGIAPYAPYRLGFRAGARRAGSVSA